MQRKMGQGKKWIVIISTSALFLLLLGRFYLYLTDDFRISNISYKMPYQEAWKVPLLSFEEEAELGTILQQNFVYIGKGSQCYAFKSENERYVLKFFKFKHLKPSWLDHLIPSSIGVFKNYKEKQAVRKARKLWGVFHAYKLAYDLNRKESGLKFIQLNCLDNFLRTVVVTDKIGFKHSLQLDQLPFILQDKGQTLNTVLTQLLKKSDLTVAEQCLGKIFDLYSSEYAKGLFDRDHHVMQNMGFVKDTVIHLDVGKLVSNEEIKQIEKAREDAEIVGEKIKAWIGKHYPEYSERLFAYIDTKIFKLYESNFE
jgi:hypothetical protein